MIAPYPAHREADVVLRDGSTVHVRPVRPEDEAELLRFYSSLSEESRILRFFSGAVDLAAVARRVSQVDYVNSYGLVATLGAERRIVAHASYDALGNGRAEVAFAIEDAHQGRGIGSILLWHLAEAANANGIQQFEAVVLPVNHRMLEVFRQSGFPIEVHSRPEELHVMFPTSITEEGIQRFERREQLAAISALKAFLYPRSVAVIGASRQRGTVGAQVFENLLWYGFEGPVYPVNPAAEVVHSVPAYPTVEAIPGPVDLAVIAVPAAVVVSVAEQCGRKGVRALVVLSAGFAETGPEGRARQAELVRICREHGMRLIGPNCLGIANTDPAVRLNAIFSPLTPPAGNVAFSSQSGALAIAAIDYAGALGLGLSSFVSVGNKADISGNDLLNYWEFDPRTSVILLYLESFGNPRRFSRIARRVGRTKPIVVVKSGRSAAGARATSSHTGALLGASDVTVDALFRQAGVIRTDTLEELFAVASLLANQPAPPGRRVGIVTNVGGPGILCADACEAQGLEVPVLSEATRDQLRELLPPAASVTNPVDMIASASADQYRRAIELVGRDPGIDAVIVIFIPPLATRDEDVARAIVDASSGLDGTKPVLSVFMSSRGVPEALKKAGVRVPSYAFPELAAMALSHAARYREWRDRPISPTPRFQDLRRDEAAALVAQRLGRGAGWLEPAEVERLLGCYGLPLLEQRVVETPEAAGAAAEALGTEVALKVVAPGLLHKTEAGAVRLHLHGAEQVRAAAVEMAERLQAAGHPPSGFLVQRMADSGVEMIVGIVHDPQFGPVIACGAGGVLVELVRDVSVGLSPLTRDDARHMIQSLRTYPLLTGFRGSPPRDVVALEEVLLRISALAEDLPQIAELDINPLLVLERGVALIDARIRVEPAEPPRPIGARR